MVSKLILEWDKELGWKDNPFQDKILMPIEEFISGYEEYRKRINLFFIKNLNLGTITGEQGTGKTTLIFWLKNELKGYSKKMKVFFIPSASNQNKLMGRIIQRYITLLEKNLERPSIRLDAQSIKSNMNYFILRRQQKSLKKKQLVLLIDDIQPISDVNIEGIKRLRELGVDCKIIASGSAQLVKNSNISRLGKDQLKIVLKGMSYDEIREMIRKRIQYVGGTDIYPFSDKNLKEIYEKGERNPRRILSLCYDKAVRLSLDKEKLPAPKREEPVMNEIAKEQSKAESKKTEKPKEKKKKKDKIFAIRIHLDRKEREKKIDEKKALEFVKHSIEEGFSEQDIEAVLKDDGFSKEESKKLIKEARKTAVQPLYIRSEKEEGKKAEQKEDKKKKKEEKQNKERNTSRQNSKSKNFEFKSITEEDIDRVFGLDK
ncbi:hypothetical protein D6745_05685 [Candidatus Woesearchaeota archaeon]|nr:MAG: hypothetical protein D6745_05685 [Candidatus Woesearchaeota archaeon]